MTTRSQTENVLHAAKNFQKMLAATLNLLNYNFLGGNNKSFKTSLSALLKSFNEYVCMIFNYIC